MTAVAPVEHPVRTRVHRSMALVLALALVQAGCTDASDGTGSGGITDTSARQPLPGAPGANSADNPISGARFWVDPASDARLTADAWRARRAADAVQLDKIGNQSQARWFGDWNSTAQLASEVDRAATTMLASGAMPVFVAYNIPQRDCGSYSANNVTAAAYRDWISAFATGLSGRRAVVVLEPDGLAETDCLSADGLAARMELMRFAVATLTAKGGLVYIDAGQAGWHPPATMARRLIDAGIAGAQGFSLNVANFATTPENAAYGEAISALVGGKHFVIDTGRNGLGSNGQWCNPAGRALGERPSSATHYGLVDAYLWIKTPGQSDGACGGTPSSGIWMPEYALGLAQRAAF